MVDISKQSILGRTIVSFAFFFLIFFLFWNLVAKTKDVLAEREKEKLTAEVAGSVLELTDTYGEIDQSLTKVENSADRLERAIDDLLGRVSRLEYEKYLLTDCIQTDESSNGTTGHVVYDCGGGVKAHYPPMRSVK